MHDHASDGALVSGNIQEGPILQGSSCPSASSVHSRIIRIAACLTAGAAAYVSGMGMRQLEIGLDRNDRGDSGFSDIQL